MNHRTLRASLHKYFASSPYPVQFAYLFGSHARGQALPHSDVDVGVYLGEPNEKTRLEIQASLLSDLMRALHTEDVDLVLLDQAPPRFAYNVIQGKPIYSANERARARAETKILSRYYDERPAILEYYRFLHRQIRAGKMTERTPEMIDGELVSERLAHIRKTLNLLKRFRDISQEEFIADEDTKDLSAHRLQTCIEAMADISNHLVAAMGLEKPTERRDAPMVLAKHGILPKNLGEQLAQAVSMRNRIVHGYSDLNPSELYTATHADLIHFEEFCHLVSTFLEKQEKRQRAKPKKGAKK